MTTLYNEQTSDADLVVAVQNGDRDAFAVLYRRYFSRIYDFAARTLRNDADAADVAQDVFVLVDTKLVQLREPAAFRGWIFSIARRQSLNRIRDRKKAQSMAPLATDDRPLNPLLTAVDASRIDDPVHASAVAELADLVWEAAAALPEKQYMLLDLSVRQGLDSTEIAEVLGVTKGNAYTMLSRMRTRLGEQIGTYLLVRKGSKHCRELALVVARAEMPPVDDQLRKQIDRHVEGCDECDDRKRRMLAPHQVLAALAAVPAPDGLADVIWDSLPSNNRSRFGRRVKKAIIVAAVILVGLGAGTVAAEYLPVGTKTTTNDVVAAAIASAATTSTIAGVTSPVPGDTVVPLTNGTVADEAGASTSSTGAPADPVTTVPPTTTTTTTLPPPTTTTTTTTTTLPPPTTTTTTTTLAPNNPPSNLIIKTPKDGAQLAVNLTIAKSAMVWQGTVGGTASDENPSLLVYEWFSDQQSQRLAIGESATVQLLFVGGNRTIHILTMRVTDEFGAVAETKITVIVTP